MPKTSNNHNTEVGSTSDFIREQINKDLVSGSVTKVVTRFPPEPNGFLHLGHAKSICLNFTIASEYGGQCNLRFDDTNPVKEDQLFIEAIKEDVKWLGFSWAGEPKYASDNFELLYEWACHLIRTGKAYVDDLTADEIREYRGTLTVPGTESPHRNRTADENLELFDQMRDGHYENGSKVLRAKIDMASGNINLRDPVIYRILHSSHPRTGEKWCIYPTYDFAHGQTDSIEFISHSLCTLEFADHRPLYDWFIENLPVPSRPHQYEFSRLNISHTVLSKRRLTQLVTEGFVAGWDDPRMPTIAGLRRRGVPSDAIRFFINELAISKSEGMVEQAMLDSAIRENLNDNSLRKMGVLKPLKIIIENYPENHLEEMEVPNHPGKPELGSRKVLFGRELWIEQDDFMEDPPRKFFRLGPGREVRLRCAYFITCREVIKNSSGDVVELRCTYDPDTRGGNAPDGRKVRGTIHWVAVDAAVNAEVRLYSHLFNSETPGQERGYLEDINNNSLEILNNCKIERSITDLKPGSPAVQFERLGYFCPDTSSNQNDLVLNRTISLRDSWAKINQ
ncbi:MAG: glutamine--tRNA ligase/YqeY domain fusion protein [Rhodospirillaceae bacterium]